MKRLAILLLSIIVLSLPAAAQTKTEFGAGAGEYKELFDALQNLLHQSSYVKKVKFNGKERNQFVPWIRDHVHVMKAMKYLTP
ncbi:MAG TPA: hypothetical protein VEZ55_09360, partial [Chitinophagaceae bacterium]|nr:hypothetical protein [Chitinophagaceae bacterium]